MFHQLLDQRSFLSSGLCAWVSNYWSILASQSSFFFTFLLLLPCFFYCWRAAFWCFSWSAWVFFEGLTFSSSESVELAVSSILVSMYLFLVCFPNLTAFLTFGFFLLTSVFLGLPPEERDELLLFNVCCFVVDYVVFRSSFKSAIGSLCIDWLGLMSIGWLIASSKSLSLSV